MQPRERILAAILSGAVALFLLSAVYSKGASAIARRKGSIAALQTEINSQKLTVQEGAIAAAQIDDWERCSLPSDGNLARTLYQSWLTELASQAKLKGVSVNSTASSEGRNGVYHELMFTVTGRGGVPQMTQFLHGFYAAGHLHRIHTLSVKPNSDPNDMVLAFTVAALALPGVDREELCRDAPNPLGDRDLAAFSAIVERKLFEAYVPPPPPVVAREERPRPAPPAFNVADHAVVTAILGVGDDPQAWVNVRTTGETLKLSEGDDFKVGNLSGTVVRINGRAMEFTSGGKRHFVALGESLAKAVVVPDES